MFEITLAFALAIVLVVAGCGGVGVALASLNDRRLARRAARLPQPTARELLDRRLATGDIDEAEYSSRLAVLLYGPPLDALESG